MRWRKLGRIYEAGAVHPKLCSHAANPLPVWRHGDVYRVFFSGRDEQNRSSVGWVDIDLAQRKTVSVCDRPAFLHGADGTFYSHGVSIGNCYEAGGRRFMLFMGWQFPASGHWYGEIGRLVVGDDLSLRLDGDGRFMALDAVDPMSLSYPWVLPTSSGYQMWYGSTLTWDAGNGGMLHVIHHADSPDGERWQRRGLAVPYTLGVAQAFSHPTVVPSGRGYQMWFSYRDDVGGKYRIGRAVSETGETWVPQLEDPDIQVSSDGWDSEMIEYPFVFDHRGARYLLYCGNGYGKTGFGLAVLEAD